MPDVTELLERLADQPPSLPRPVEEVQTQARHRRQEHRRRVAVATTLGVVLVTGLTIAGVVAAIRPGPEVQVGGPDQEGPAADGPTLTESRGGLTVRPSSGLDDGDTITLSLEPDPGGEVVATQCAAEVLDFTEEGRDVAAGSRDRRQPSRLVPTDWCGSTFSLRSPAGRPDLTMPVSRLQRTPVGDVDCASAPGRCVVMVGEGLAPLGDRFAPLVFAEDLPPVPTPTLQLDGGEGPVDDGQVVRVVGRDLPRSVDEVRLTQCVGEPGDAIAPDGANAPCDLARAAMVPVAADGSFTADVRAFGEIVTPESAAARPGAVSWVRCRPCLLVASATNVPAGPNARSAAVARLPLEVTVTGEPIHPTLQVTPGAPHRPGQRVRVEGAGFQAGQDVGISSCPAGSWEACGFPGEGFTTADAGGRFTIEGYPLPGADGLGGPCAARAGACVVAWAPSTAGAPPAVTIPLDLSG